MEDHPNVREYIGDSSIRTGRSGRSIFKLSVKEELQWSTRTAKKHIYENAPRLRRRSWSGLLGLWDNEPWELSRS
jgi:hypothetical protein